MGQTRFDVDTSNSRTHAGSNVPSTARSTASVHPVGQVAAPSPREPVEPVTQGLLVISRGPEAGREIEITASRTTIGRSRDCDIVLDDGTISIRHADLLRQGDRYVLIDSGALNGVYVNREVVERAELVDGDEIWIGKVRFVFRTPE